MLVLKNVKKIYYSKTFAFCYMHRENLANLTTLSLSPLNMIK